MNLKFSNMALALACALAMGAMTSCNNNDDDDETVYTQNFTFDDFEASQYNDENVWKEVYNPDITYMVFNGLMSMTHNASVSEYNGVKYYSWTGFCPSRNSDTGNFPNDWTNHQWSSITGSGVTGSTGYVVGFWDVQESTQSIPEKPSMEIAFAGKAEPMYVMLTNNTYAYYTMLNGSAYSKKFTSEDWFKVIIHGVKDGVETGKVEFYLARNGQIVDDWQLCDLRSLGTVNSIYMQMESSDSGQWGMNTPAYVCMDNLVVNYFVK